MSRACKMLQAQRGQTMPFLALLLFVLVGVLGLSVDVGSYRHDQRLQQSAADSAAIAGAAELNGGAANATAAAKADSAKNGFTDGVNGVTVAVTANFSDQYTGSSPAVQVVVSKAYPKYFGGILAPGTTAIAATAVARAANIGSACVYQLNPGGSPNFNGMTFNGNQCGIVMNGTGNFNGAHIDAGFIGYAGGAAPNENGATFVNAEPEPTLTVIDPCPRIPGCYYFANNPPSTSSCPAFAGNGYHGVLNPGCYGAMNLNGAVVTFNPGIYVINSSTNFNGAVLTGTGVTFYVTSTGSFNFNGARINLAPPTSGSTSGVLIYQVPGNTNNPNFNGASSDIVSGLMYFPSVSVNFNGSLGAYTVLVVGDVNFNGSTQNFPSPPPNSSLIQQPTLAE